MIEQARYRSRGSTAACGRSASGRPRTSRLTLVESFGDLAAERLRRGAPEHRRLLRQLRLRWPSSSPTASTRNWLIRLDLPDPEIPGDAREHAERNVDVQPIEIVARHPAKLQPALRRTASFARSSSASSNRYGRVRDAVTSGKAWQRTAVQHLVRRARRRRDRRRRSSRLAARRRVRARRRTANCRTPSADPARAAAPRVSAGCSPADGSSST